MIGTMAEEVTGSSPPAKSQGRRRGDGIFRSMTTGSSLVIVLSIGSRR
jgi:phosphate transport system permease protein